MGGVENLGALRSGIFKQAQEQASATLDRARRVAERDIEFAKEEAEEIRQQQKAKVQPMVDMEQKKVIASAEMEARRRLLEKKSELVSRLFDEAEKKLEEMRGSEQYIDMICRWIENGIADIGTELTVEFGEKDKAIFTPEVVSSIESNIKKSTGAEAKLRFKCVGEDISAGIIIRSKDGKAIIDNSFSSLLKRLKEDLRGEISEILLKE